MVRRIWLRNQMRTLRLDIGGKIFSMVLMLARQWHEFRCSYCQEEVKKGELFVIVQMPVSHHNMHVRCLLKELQAAQSVLQDAENDPIRFIERLSFAEDL